MDVKEEFLIRLLHVYVLHWSEHLESYIENQFNQDWTELTPRERVRVALSISQLLVPKPTPEPTEAD